MCDQFSVNKVLNPCKSCFPLWKLRFSVASPPYKIGSWPREILCVDEIRSGRILPAGFLPPLRHMLLHLLTLTILLDSAGLSLENRSVCLMLLGSLLKIDQWSILKREPNKIKQKITIRAHSPTLQSTHDRFALDNQAENHYKRSFTIVKSTNSQFSLDNQAG